MVKFSSNLCIVDQRRIPLFHVMIIVASLSLILGHIEFRSAWAQDDSNPDVNLKEQIRYADEKGLAVTLNDVTWANKSQWAFQAIIAPERLRDIAPIYVYPWNAGIIGKYDSRLADTDLYVGVAAKFSKSADGEEITWKALPLSPHNLEIALRNENERTSVDSNDDFPYIVSSKPIADMQEVQTLWIQKGYWEDGLSRTLSESSSE